MGLSVASSLPIVLMFIENGSPPTFLDLLPMLIAAAFGLNAIVTIIRIVRLRSHTSALLFLALQFCLTVAVVWGYWESLEGDQIWGLLWLPIVAGLFFAVRLSQSRASANSFVSQNLAPGS